MDRTCRFCQVPLLRGVCPDCGVKPDDGPEATGVELYAGSDCAFRTGGWQCRWGRYANPHEREGLVFCKVHAVGLRMKLSTMDDLFEVLLELRADAQKRQRPHSITCYDGSGGWLYGCELHDCLPGGQPKPGFFVPFHWLPIEQCWKMLTGHDALPAVAVVSDSRKATAV